MKKKASKKEETANSDKPVVSSSLKFWLRKAFEEAREGKIEKIPVLIDQYGGVNIEEHFVPNKYKDFDDWFDQNFNDR